MSDGLSDVRLRMDVSDQRLWDGDREVPLTSTSFSMLAYFACHPGRLITKQELLENVWPHTFVGEGLIKDYVRKIRQALGDDQADPTYIETVRGHGYRFIGDIAVVGSNRLRAVQAVATDSTPTIAVLPFADASDNGDQAYFAAGVAEDIVAELARFRSLRIIARDSTSLFGPRPASIDQVAHDLNADYVVTGSVRRADNKIRIHVRLLEAAGGVCIWAERYDRYDDEVFAVESEVSAAIVSTLVGRLEEFGRQRAARKRPENLEVYDCLLLGDWYLRLGTRDDVLEARRMFAQAIELEPNNARAHAEMAFSYMTEFWSEWTTEPKLAADKAFEFASRAVALDHLDSRAHLYLAVAYHYGRSNFEAAELEYQKALELNPNDYDIFCLRSWLLALSGQTEQGIACAEQAIRLSPLTTEDCRIAQCVAAYCARDYDRALQAVECIVEPSNEANAYRAMCLAQLGRTAEGRAAMTAFLTEGRRTIADFPDRDSDRWRQYWAVRYPFKHAADLEHMLGGFRLAGLP